MSNYQHSNVSMIKKILRESGTMTDQLIKKGSDIVDFLTMKKIDFEKVIALSKLNDKEIIDPVALYNRLKRLSNDDWKRIIDLGEQTQTLGFNELSVIKTVFQKIKREENIDLKRLEIVDISIKKLKKFGVKY